MKLYVYDHCPYCVRARMIFGLRQVPVELVYLSNDDESTPIGLIGAKQVPILQKEDGSHMGESLDIVRYIDEYAGSLRLNETIRPEIQTWFEQFSNYGNRLIMPRDVQLNLPEFATPEAIAYFTQKKEAQLGASFATLLQESTQYVAQAEQALAQLAQWLPAQSPYFGGDEPNMEDIIIFPLLRNLSMVRDVTYPANLRDYVQKLSAISQVPLYFDCAI